MRKFTSCLVTMILANILAIGAFAQNLTLSGNVKNNATGENAAAVSVTVKGTDNGTFTDDKGNFTISTKSVPATLIISSVGYTTQEVNVTGAGQSLKINFVPSNELGQEVVVSATRVTQKILESPVSIERVSAAAIRSAPAASYYDVVTNLKGVDVVTSSLTFKTPTTRGFAGSGNVRFNQIMDGMDNQAPGLNFSVGSVIGLSQLDVDNIELLPGASSALYGPGGMNGTLLINSKSPFKYQGFSAEIKTGIMHTDHSERPASPYYNWTMRLAKKVSEKFAFKVTGELIQAKDWIATDERNYNRIGSLGFVTSGTRLTDPNYDGINVYGDETSVDIRPFLQGIGAQAPFLQTFINTLTVNPLKVSRTGYAEKDVINPNTINFKAGGSVNYKITPRTELIVAGYWGTGNTVYTGSDRYSLKDLKVGQYKIELMNKNWMVRGYTTQENSGQSFNAGATLALLNEAWKPSVTRTNGIPTPQISDWYVQYSQAFLQNKLAGQSDYDANNNARTLADVGRPIPGTAAFTTLFDKVRKVPIPFGGLFVDQTDLYNVEGQYNFSEYTGKVVDVMVGGNYKKYVLNSRGTLFADKVDSTIGINEYGGYLQLGKGFADDKLRITASGRYDKNENFEGRFTPRATALIKVAPNNNVRLSYQTAYRFPSTQQQWINLQLNGYKLIGGQPYFTSLYKFDTNPAYNLDDLRKGNIVKAPNEKYRPEQVSTFEVGYKGLQLSEKLLIDAFGYWGQYKDFLTRSLIVQNTAGAPISVADTSTATGSVFSVPVNIKDKVKTYGFGLSVDYKLPMNFVISANASSDQISTLPAGYVSFFNSPKYRANATIANNGFGKLKRYGFNVTYRWQDSFFYQGDFASGNVPSFQTLDAQVSAKLPATKTIIKLGANNLLNQYYVNAIGNARVGGLYYVSFGFNLY
jgi:outer membrane receptor protein involved in Fe transport